MNDDIKSKVLNASRSYKHESEEARRKRIQTNRENFDCYHLIQDYSHKIEGQSVEFLPKQTMAVEQITQFFQQGLVDAGEWFSVEASPGVNKSELILSPEEVKKIMQAQLDKANFMTVIGDSIKMGLLGSLCIVKNHGKFCDKIKFFSDEEIVEDKEGNIKTKKVLKKSTNKYWNLNLETVRQEDYYIDPTGAGLYLMHEIYLDKHLVNKLAEDYPDIYNKEEIAKIPGGSNEDQLHKAYKARETNQNAELPGIRKKVKLQEFWGCIIDENGDLLFNDCVWTVAEDNFLIREPKKFPFWHGKTPFIAEPILRVPHSVWHRALMDAPTKLNTALNELFNLVLDGGMMATYGIKQIRPSWLDDESQISGGVKPGQTLSVNDLCPVGGKVVERVDTSSLSQESLSVLNLVNSELSASSLTNDLRMGVMPQRAVKATEVVEASQSITSVFNGIAKTLENNLIEPNLSLAWQNCIQNLKKIDPVELQTILGSIKVNQIMALDESDLYSNMVDGYVFKVFGISRTLGKVKDFRKLTAMLQTISGSQVLMMEFMKKYNMTKLLDEIMRALDISPDKLMANEQELAENKKQIAMMQQTMLMQNGGAEAAGIADQTQIPQASTGSLNPNNQMIPGQA